MVPKPGKQSRSSDSQWLPDNSEGQHRFSITLGSQLSGSGLFQQGTQPGTGEKCQAKAKGKAAKA